MNKNSIFRSFTAICLLACLFRNSVSAWEPLRAHPQNPYILEFRGEPTVLRTFGEHYSSLINSDFDFVPYLNILQRDGMNLTRTFLVGFRLVESDSVLSPLSPTPANFVQPWQRNSTQGNALDGLGKWDFSAWNEDYFVRLNAFAQACSDRGIAIELTFFCTQYDTAHWQVSPFNPANNVQGFGPASHFDSLRPVDANLLAAQEAVVRRIVREVNRFDNIYFEIVNEPFWDEPGVKDAQEADFHNRMLAIIRSEESGLPNRHLVAHNFPQQLGALSSDFDVINEHYPATVPATTIAGAEALLRDQYWRGRILALDETNTASATHSRLESWMFILGGGGIYSGLDVPYSIYTDQDESGDTAFGRASREAIRNIATYLTHLNLVGLRRDLSWVTGGLPAGATLQAMSEPGQQYVAYLHHGRAGITAYQISYNPIDGSSHTASPVVTLPQGTWRAVWTRPVDLVELRTEVFTHSGGARTLAPVTYQEDAALRIDRIVAGPNVAPVAIADTYTTFQNIPFVVPAAGILANDTDAQFSQLTAVLDVGPVHGILTLVPDGGFTYTPAASYIGADSFTYHANDGSLNSNVVTVAITVNAVTAAAFSNGSFESNFTSWTRSGNLEIQTAALNAIPEGIKYVAFNSGDSPANGVLAQTFTTIAGQTYVVSFQMGADGANPNEQLLRVDVTGTTALVSQTFSIFGLGGADTRWLVKSLTFTATGPAATLTFSDQSQSTNSIDLQLDNVRVIRSSGSSNSAPIAENDSFFTNMNTVIVVPATGVLANDTDGEANPLTATINAGPSHGILTLNPNGGFTYTPASDYTGDDSFTYHANDGTLNSNVVSVAITVNAVVTGAFFNGGFESSYTGWTRTGNQVIQSAALNTIPEGLNCVAFNSAQTTPDGVLAQTFTTTPGQNYVVSFHMGVLSYNTNEQRLQVDVTGTTALVSRTFSLFGLSGGTTRWLANSLSFTAAGTAATLTFRDRSPSTSAIDLLLDNVKVTAPAGPANTVPVAVADAYLTNRDAMLVVPAAGVLTNDTDAQSNPLTAVLNVGPSHGILSLNPNGGFTYTPAAGFAGADSFIYHANDGTLNSNLVTVGITVNAIVTGAFLNGDFESGYTGWISTGNQVIQSVPPNTIPDGIKYVGFNIGNTTPNGMLAQTFATIPGRTYVVSFYMGVLAYNTNEQRLQVDVTGATTLVTQTFSIFGLGGGITRWTDHSLSFTAATTAATLTFRDRSPSTSTLDLLLDGVRITVSPVPDSVTILPIIPTISGTPGNITIRMTATVGGVYFLECSEDLAVWQRIDSAVLAGPGPITFQDSRNSDALAPSGARMFYRIGTETN